MKFSLPLRVKDKIGALHNFCLTLNSNFAFSLQSKTSRSFDVAFVGIIKAFDAVWSNMLTKNLQEELFTHKEEMDLETAQTTTTAKLPILKQGEYDMWRLRIEQYLSSLVTTKEKAQKKNDVKARSMLLMALPNEHLMTFNQYKDAKTLFATIQTRFGGNDATKLQKIVSQMAILGEIISQEDLNLKFLRSLPSEWNTHVVVWRNKPDLDTMSFDNLYDNFKLLNKRLKELQAQAQAQVLRIWLLCHPLAVLIKLILLMELVPTIHFIQPNGSQLVYEDLEQIHEDDIRRDRFKVAVSIAEHEDNMMGHFARECRGPMNQDNSNKNQDSSRRTINVEETSFKAMVAIDGAATNKEVASVGSTIVLYQKELRVFFCEQLAVLKRDISYKDSDPSMLKSELEKLKQEKESNQLKIENFDNASKSLEKLIGSQIIDKSRKGLEEFQQPEFEGYGPKTSKNVSEDTSNEVRESPDSPMVKKLVSDDKLEKKTVFSTVAKIEFVRPKQQEKPVRKPVKHTAITIKGKGWNLGKIIQGSKVFVLPDGCKECISVWQDWKKEVYDYKWTQKMLDLSSVKNMYGSEYFEEVWFFNCEDSKYTYGDFKAIMPDIMFAVCACARFQVTPKVSHLHAVKRIFRYLKGQPKLGLWYPKDSPFDLEAYSDSDYAGASLDRKSTTGVAFLEKPEESNVFEGIINFLNASSVKYALTVNPTIYTSCIKQLWATAKAKTVNGEMQIQALVDGKKVID
ncbi:hypothetical protein Tco_1420852, partial [Tanacetum coccineum]